MAKQVFRRRDHSGRFCGDHVTRADETAEGEPLLVPILRAGRLVGALPSLESIRKHCREQLAALPERLLSSDAKPDYPITYSDAPGGRRPASDGTWRRSATELYFACPSRYDPGLAGPNHLAISSVRRLLESRPKRSGPAALDARRSSTRK